MHVLTIIYLSISKSFLENIINPILTSVNFFDKPIETPYSFLETSCSQYNRKFWKSVFINPFKFFSKSFLRIKIHFLNLNLKNLKSTLNLVYILVLHLISIPFKYNSYRS